MAKRKHSPFLVSNLEIKSIEKENDPDFFIVVGYASIYGNIDSYRDIVEPGSFTQDLIENGNERPILWQHQSDKPIGIGMFEDDKNGLKVTIKMPKASDFVSKEVMPLIDCKAVSGLSIGYWTIEDSYDSDQNVNRLEKLKLRETSIVTFPANESAQIIAAKFAKFLEEKEPTKGFELFPILPIGEDYLPSDIEKELKANTNDNEKAYSEGCLIDNQYAYIKFIDGKKNIAPNIIFKATADILSEKITASKELKDFCDDVYAKLGQEAPFAGSGFIDHTTLKAFSKKGLVRVLGNSNIKFSAKAKEKLADSFCCPEPDGEVIGSDAAFLTQLKNDINEIKGAI